MNQEELRKRIDEVAHEHEEIDHGCIPESCPMTKRIYRLEQLYDDLYEK